MASRYGSMKQVEGFGPTGETIMDYSIYDAIRAGFKKVVFIIREEFAENFRKIFDAKLEGRVEVEYVYQDLTDYMNGFEVPAGRTKPWGTAHAVMCAKEAVHEPFAVINADDFYGRDAFKKAYDFLVKECNPRTYAIIGYELLKTLSENGTVNRGVCEVDKQGNLVSISERLNISKQGDKIICDDNQEPKEIPMDSKVSMNFWCFEPSIFDYSEQLFKSFLEENREKPKAEFFIPIVADRFIEDGAGSIKVIATDAQWFGVTYKEDAPELREHLNDLVKQGEYPGKLWQDKSVRTHS